MGPGWRHSYSRSISVNLQDSTPSTALYPGQSATVSAQYPGPATACASGFADIQGAVSAWSGAGATYTNNVCVISNGGGTIGTLRIKSLFPDSPQPTAVEYDVVRDDGQTFRYTTQGGSVTDSFGNILEISRNSTAQIAGVSVNGGGAVSSPMMQHSD
jgi:hypothetical protein